MKIVALVQARVGSTRLPGKVLMDLAGEPMLARVVNRTRRARTIAQVVVATTDRPADDAIADLCKARGWDCFRGDEADVLDRYYRAAMCFEADAVLRITSDCPLIEPELIDRLISEFDERQPGIDYASTLLPHRTFPRGLDAEVMLFGALEKAWREDADPARREHVTPYIHGRPDLFRLHGVTSDVDYSHLRWTVDTEEDLALVRLVYSHFGQDSFSWREVLKLLEEHPDWAEINSHIEQKEV